MSKEEIAERMFRDKAGWFELIKALRQAHAVGVFEAEALAFRHEGWRRWVQQRIDSDPKCRKYAAAHVKRHGAQGHIVQQTSPPALRLRQVAEDRPSTS